MTDLTFNAVRKSFGPLEIVKGIDLAVKSGEFVVFVGPSGCGKSTLLRMIAGLESVTSGQIVIGGEDVTNTPPAQRGIAMVFQSYALFPHMNVGENISFGMRLAHQPRELIAKRVNEVADILQIKHLLDRRPKQLSGGSGSAWRSAVPSSAIPRCSCSTSRFRTSTRRCACRCGSRLPACIPSWAPPWST